jgi:hypothetical protein
VLADRNNQVITNLDLRTAQNLFINIDVKLDPSSRLLTWTFTSIDPQTGLSPIDATVGFLPPGAEGTVFFTMLPKKSLPTGTELSDQAAIVFDVNPPMSTNTWVNTLDVDSPMSSKKDCNVP